jgi:hypothetical protein
MQTSTPFDGSKTKASRGGGEREDGDHDGPIDTSGSADRVRPWALFLECDQCAIKLIFGVQFRVLLDLRKSLYSFA